MISSYQLLADLFRGRKVKWAGISDWAFPEGRFRACEQSFCVDIGLGQIAGIKIINLNTVIISESWAKAVSYNDSFQCV